MHRPVEPKALIRPWAPCPSADHARNSQRQDSPLANSTAIGQGDSAPDTPPAHQGPEGTGLAVSVSVLISRQPPLAHTGSASASQGSGGSRAGLITGTPSGRCRCRRMRAAPTNRCGAPMNPYVTETRRLESADFSGRLQVPSHERSQDGVQSGRRFVYKSAVDTAEGCSEKIANAEEREVAIDETTDRI